MEKFGFRFLTCWQKFLEAANFPTPEFKWVWLVLFMVAAIVMLYAIISSRANMAADFAESRDLILFGGVALAAGVAGFLVFIRVANFPTQPWYYVPLIAFIAVCLNAILAQCARWIQHILAVVAGLAVVMAYPSGVNSLKCGQTNMDIVAARLTAEATAHDYIVIHPWYYGVSFTRYYKGASLWDTLPPLDDHTIHRYDQFKVEMQKTNAIQPVLARIAATLQSGHRVWMLTDANGVEIPAPGSQPHVNLPLPPLRTSRWSDTPYSAAWQSQAMCFVSDHSRRFEPILFPADKTVNPDEDLRLLVAIGWQTNTSSASKITPPAK